MTDWIAETAEGYVELAVRKAGELHALAALRGQLRGMVSSVLGDQEAYVRSVEAEYRQLWRALVRKRFSPRAHKRLNSSRSALHSHDRTRSPKLAP